MMARQASRFLWVGVLGAALVWWSFAQSPAAWALFIAWAVFIPVAILLTIPPLRRSLLIKPLLSLYRSIMPGMSDTEREALEAGTVWWEAELFGGQPDWHHLLGFPAPELSKEEQAFLDGPTEELCAMISDWDDGTSGGGESAEDEARARGWGLWADPDPINPYEWRKIPRYQHGNEER